MLFLLAFLVLFAQALAQDPGCDFVQYVQPNQRYIISSPRYANSYPQGVTCRWRAECPTGYQCRLDCLLEIPLTPACRGDRLLISRTGDPQLNSAEVYCGRQRLPTIMSVSNISYVALLTSSNSTGGRFMCNLTAQAAPQPPCKCGIRKVNRIVGGTEVGVNEYSSTVGITEKPTGRIYCGGTLISDWYILTAAHCCYRRAPADFSVSIGNKFLNEGTMYNVTNIYIHPNYNPENYDYDSCLMRLDRKVPFSGDFSPACLPFMYQGANLTGVTVTFLGWGTKDFGAPTSPVLLKTDVKIISQEQCRQSQSEPITNRQVCTFYPRHDACQKDSGGPGMYADPVTGRDFILLTISYGNGCGSTSPGVNTRITSMEIQRWIVETTRADFCVVGP